MQKPIKTINLKMKNSNNILIISALTLLSLNVYAQENNGINNKKPEKNYPTNVRDDNRNKPLSLTITKGKLLSSPTSMSNLSANSTQISGAEAALRGQTSLDDVLQYNAPGFIYIDKGQGYPTVFNMGIGSQYTQYFLNGVPLPSNSSGISGLFNFPTSMTKEYEIVRGGSSFLYGGNAVTGIVNINTYDPGYYPNSISFGYGSNQTYQTQINISKKNNEWGIGLSLNQYATQGYDINTGLPNFNGNTKYKNKNDNQSALINLTHYSTTSKTSLIFLEYHTNYAPYQSIFPLDPSKQPTNGEVAQNTQTTRQISLNHNQKLSKQLDLNFVYAFTESNYVQFSNYDVYQNYVRTTLKYHLNKKSYLTFGGQYEHSDISSSYNEKEIDRALLFNSKLYLTNKWSINGGAKFNSFSQFKNAQEYSAGTAYEFTPRTSLYYSYSKSITLPTPYDVSTTIGKNQPKLKPSYSYLNEVGLKNISDWENSSIENTLSVFQGHFVDLINYINFIATNQNSFKSKGIEYQISITNSFFSWLTNITYTQAKDNNGNFPDQVPKWLVKDQVGIPIQNNLNLYLTHLYVGKTKQVQYYSYNYNPYNLFNVSLNYEVVPQFKTQFVVNNIFNHRAITYVQDKNTQYYTEGRSYMFTINYLF
ncbi:TonB-dependent receptor plug domain-containing protein [Paraphotobacterium marinum]|nr:TonB-dependent receptor [Paraphotobacterium marinum]